MPKMPASGGDFKLVPAGNWPARCVSLIDYGKQEVIFQGEKKPDKRQCYFRWELYDDEECTMDDGRPMVIGKSYTFSSSPKANLRKVIEAWTGSPYDPDMDIESLIGKVCLVNVTHYTNKDGEERAAVNTVSKLPKGVKCPEQVNDPVFFWLDRELYDHELYEGFPDWLRDKIAKSPEWKELNGVKPSNKPKVGQASFGDDDDDAPF